MLTIALEDRHLHLGEISDRFTTLIFRIQTASIRRRNG